MESDTQQQFVRFLGYAKASAGETRAQLYVALDVGYIQQDQFAALFDRVDKCSRQLSAFMTYLKTHPNRRQLKETAVEYEIDVNTF